MADRALAAAVVAALLGAALPAGAATHTVTVEGMQFAPQVLTIHRGDKVTWVNKDLVPHTATAAGVFDSGSIAAGATWSHVGLKAGRYEYKCSFHPTMKATVVVE